MVLFVVYGVYNDEKAEALFSAVATAVFIMPFFLLSALAGQLADTRDKAQDHPHRQILRNHHHVGRRHRACAGVAWI